MSHQARVTDAHNVAGDDATDYGLVIGDAVTVVGFIEQGGGLMAVIVDHGDYLIVPYWMLKPEPIAVPA